MRSVPMSIFLIWFAGVIIWMPGVSKGLVVAQLDVFSHLKKGGDEFASGAALKFCIYLMNMLLRPSLMCIGFFIGATVSIFGGTVLLKIFTGAMAAAQGNSTTGLLSIAVYFIVFCYALQQLISLTMNPIHALPDSVMTAIGGADEHTSEKMIAAGVTSKIAGAQGPSSGGGGGEAPQAAGFPPPRQASS